MASDRMMAVNASCIVTGRALPIMAVTDWLGGMSELPRSPCRMPLAQLPNRVATGSSRPSSSLAIWYCSAVAPGPTAEAAESPGTASIRKNAPIAASMTTTTACRPRSPMNLSTW